MLEFESIKFSVDSLSNDFFSLNRAKVPGGWLITLYQSITFYPDPRHEWDGSSLQDEGGNRS